MEATRLARARSQIEKLDSDLMHPAFCRARFIKLSKKVMLCYAKKWKGSRRFTNLPRSPIRFDKDRIAKFIDAKMSKKPREVSKGRLYEIAKLRVSGKRFSEIGDKFGLHPQQMTREVNKILKFFVEYVDLREDGKDFVHTIEQTPLEETASK